jgi:hypothetical protein
VPAQAGYSADSPQRVSCAMSIQDLTGQRFGNLTVLSGPYGRYYQWECRCDCGSILRPQGASLKHGQIQCRKCALKKAWEGKRTHGRSASSEHGIWQGLQQRCSNPKARFYHRYGGRGIQVCQRWINSFEDFFSDMGPRPSKKHSIDRIDNDGHYEPGNCRWATKSVQCNNTSKNTLVVFRGTTKTMSEWAEEIGMNYSTLLYRFRRGWTVEKALTINTLKTHEKNPSGIRNSTAVLLRRI